MKFPKVVILLVVAACGFSPTHTRSLAFGDYSVEEWLNHNSPNYQDHWSSRNRYNYPQSLERLTEDTGNQYIDGLDYDYDSVYQSHTVTEESDESPESEQTFIEDNTPSDDYVYSIFGPGTDNGDDSTAEDDDMDTKDSSGETHNANNNGSSESEDDMPAVDIDNEDDNNSSEDSQQTVTDYDGKDSTEDNIVDDNSKDEDHSQEAGHIFNDDDLNGEYDDLLTSYSSHEDEEDDTNVNDSSEEEQSKDDTNIDGLHFIFHFTKPTFQVPKAFASSEDASGETPEVRAPSAYSSDNLNLLTQLSRSSANSPLLDNTYAENIEEFKPIYNELKDSIFMLYEENEQISEDFLNTANTRSTYNDGEHTKLVEGMSSMLEKIDDIRARIVQMQNVEQRLNYHLLLKALLKEIHGEKRIDYQRYAATYL